MALIFFRFQNFDAIFEVFGGKKAHEDPAVFDRVPCSPETMSVTRSREDVIGA